MNDQDSTLSLVEKVLASTRERIVRGEYEPGTRLRLNTLAAQSGVSLIPVREALRILEAERLVRTVPNKGATVAELSVEDMNDLYSVRIQLEGEAVASSKPFTVEETATFEALLADMAEAKASGDTERAMLLHRGFHFGLYDRADSGWRSYLIDILWKHADRYQWLSLLHRNDIADAEHRAIFAAMASGDVAKAAAALRSHLDTTRGLLERAFAATAQSGAAVG